MQALLWTGAGGAVAVSVAAMIAERRRARRPRLDAVGFMPWTAIHVGALFAAAALAFLAAHQG